MAGQIPHSRMDMWILDHPSTHARDDSEDYICELEAGGCGALLPPDETTEEIPKACSVCGNEDLSRFKAPIDSDTVVSDLLLTEEDY